MTDHDVSPSPGVRSPGSDWRPWLYVGMLAFAYMVSFVDRQILSLLVAPIRHDLRISDTQFSMLHGLAFACFYAVFGFPLGWLVDRTNRIRLVAAGVATWSIATMCCGLAGSYHQLFVARVFVGVGEAALSPAAYSLLYDLFDRKRLSRALAVYGAGVTVGAGLAYTIGGAVIGQISRAPTLALPGIGTIFAWQASFIAVGLPGVVLAVLFLFVAEPQRKRRRVTQPEQPTGRSDDPIDWPLLVGHNIGFALIILSSSAHNAWIPAYLARNYGLAPAVAGSILGSILLVGGTLGLFGSGWLSDRYVARGSRSAPLTIMTSAAIVAALLCPIAYSGGALPLSLTCTAVIVTISIMSSMLGPASLQMIMPPQRLGRVSALFIFVITIIGQGGGPVAVALVSDKVLHDERAIGVALGLVAAVALLLGSLVLTLIRKRFLRAAQLLAASPSTSI